MTEDAALDAFSGDDTGEEDNGGGDAGPSDSVAAAQSTYAWSPDDRPCEACGAAVARRWRDGDELVCGECKEW